MIKTRNIRFDYNNAEKLIIRGLINREYLANSKDGKIIIEKLPIAMTKRLSSFSDMEILNHDEWIFVRCGDEDAIDLIYADDEEKTIYITVTIVPEENIIKEEPVEEPETEEPDLPVEESKIEVEKSEVIENEEEVELINKIKEKPISLMDTVKDLEIEPLNVQLETDSEPVVEEELPKEEVKITAPQKQVINIQKSKKKHKK